MRAAARRTVVSPTGAPESTLGWSGIVRLGLVQAAIGSIVVIATSTLNRVMVVELALPAVFPGLLVALHYAVQMARTRVGHGSDAGGRLTSWIIGGMAVLAVGGVGASASIALMSADRTAGMIAAIAAFATIGVGVGACGTSLLVLLANSVSPARRPAAATITWVMMFVGFVITTAAVGQFLDPYSHVRLIGVTAGVAIVAFAVTALAVRNMESGARQPASPARTASATFRSALQQVWSEPAARHFTVFVFLSMLAYSGQELLLEPFAGRVFLLTPARSAQLASLQHGGALCGMLTVAFLSALPARWRINSLRAWTVGGCVASAAALFALVMSAFAVTSNMEWPLRGNVFVLGLANGVFAVAAIGSMMSLVSAGAPGRQGIRMGLWGAAQAVAFALGGAVSSAAVDLVGHFVNSPPLAYSTVFAAQAVLFIGAAIMAVSVGKVAVPVMDVCTPPAIPSV